MHPYKDENGKMCGGGLGAGIVEQWVVGDMIDRPRFYFLLPTSENYRQAVPAKIVCVYCDWHGKL